MTTAQTIEQILNKRKKSVNQIVEVTKELQKSIENAKQFKESTKLILKFSSEKKEALFGSKEKLKEFEDRMKDVDNYIELLQDAVNEYEALSVRFQRKTVNLGVVGKMGSGKSLFLQKLSNLSDEFIPSANGESCTGVTSVIENVPGLEIPQVLFFMKDEKTVLNEIKKELQNLYKAIMGKKLGELGLAQMQDLDKLGLRDIQSLDELLDCLDKKCNNLASEIPTSLSQDGEEKIKSQYVSEADALNEFKELYFEKRKKWRPLVYPVREEHDTEERWKEKVQGWKGKIQSWKVENSEALEVLTEGESPCCELQDLSNNVDRLKNYIAKRSVNENPNSEIKFNLHVYHIAIQKAVIKTKFPNVDSRICLIDTVGIGDTAADTEDRMNRAIDAESDGLIFIYRCPESMREYVGEEVSALADICEKRLEKRPGDWTAFLVNVKSENDIPDSWIRNFFEKEICDSVMGDVSPKEMQNAAALKDHIQKLSKDAEGKGLFSDILDDSGQYIRMKDVVNVGKQEKVNEFIQRFLQQLSETLEYTDAIRKKSARDKEADAREAEKKLCKKLGELKIPSGDDDWEDIVRPRMENKQKNLEKKYFHYSSDGVDQLLRNQTENLIPPLEMHLKHLTKLKDGGSVNGISLKMIAETSWDNHIKDIGRARLRAIEMLYMEIRRISSISSNTYEKVEKDYKQDMAKIFVETLGINWSKVDDTSNECFFEIMGKTLFDEVYNADPIGKEVQRYFYALQNFRLNDLRVMAESIVSHVSYECLCKDGIQMTRQTAKTLQKETKKEMPAKENLKEENVSIKMNFLSNNSIKIGQNENKVLKEDNAIAQYTDKGVEQEIECILKEKLEIICNEIQKYVDKSKFYDIGASTRLKEETESFSMCLREPYRRVWSAVFRKLYAREAIMQNDMAKFKEIRETAAKIKTNIGEFAESMK